MVLLKAIQTGHPSPETLEALEKYSILTYRTDLDGTVQFTLP